MRLENSVSSTNNQKTSRFANYGFFPTGRKSITPPPSIVEQTCHHSAAAIGFDAGKNPGFGAGENDWLGAEAYVDPLR